MNDDPLWRGQTGTLQPGRMSELISSYDWSRTPLGHVSGWDDGLKAAVRILVTSRFPMWMAWGPQLTFLYNDAYASVTLGKKHPWALGKPAPEVWPEIWQDIGPRVERVMSTGEASWEETLGLILERSGFPEETYHTFSYSPLAGSDGRIEGMLCVVMEDTQRVRGERQLSSLSTLAGALVGANLKKEVFAAIEQGLAAQKDIPFALVYCFESEGSNLCLVARSGIESDDPAAPKEMDSESVAAPWPVHVLFETNRPLTLDLLGDRFPELPSGVWNKPPHQARLVPIFRRGQEKPAGVFIAALNPYRQFDASYAEFLDLTAGQIAASITNAEAYEAEKRRAEELADLDRAKTAFFSNVSHELRTPLTLILGPVEDALLNEKAPSIESLQMLHRNALRLLKLVNGVLDFVRIEVGRMQATYQPTDLSLLTAQLASVFRSAVERAGLTLVIDCPPLPEPVYVDRDMWEKIVLNLLSNALKATFDGEIRVSISGEENGALLTIHDTGTGIGEDDLANLFERFRRIEGARRRSHEGSGIGLALVHELVTMHGGSIEVQSKLGDGTEFKVHLPYGYEHLKHGNVGRDSSSPLVLQGSAIAYVQEALGWLPGQDQIQNEVAGPAADGDQLAAKTRPVVLLVDDNNDMREYVRTLLATRFEVVSAGNGRAALDEIRHRAPDLVLTDVMMPEMDGFALLDAVRKDPATAFIPVIMLSARAGEEARIEGVESGADDYLTKPFAARELIARVDAQLKMARMRREASDQKAALTQEINRARQFAGEALEHVPIAFCTMSRDYQITYMNAAAAQLGARSGKSLVGASFWDLYPEIIGTEVEANVRRAMEDRVPIDFEQFFSGPEGESWFHFSVHPQPGEGIILYCSNTTEARKSEQALRRSEQLAAAGRLAASIAHEINNPLEAVTNLLFLAKSDEGLSASSKDLLEIADKELQRLSHITARSLKFYRQRTAPAAIALEEVLDSVVYFHDPIIRVRGIQIDRRFRPAPLVLCQPGEIQQVFTNLISNALDAIPDKGRLILEVRPSTSGGSIGVAVTIADNGSGMDKQMLQRLFHPFVTTKGEAGTGLGLWVSKGILDKHHATVRVRTRPGRGTVFRIFFPIAS
ncbi:ATP-binding protein [Occallatibacter savannae]|uniref:ATP-binding protein n=1 Tax=Occallatibacter savannae TaxID=1002691 RepID=UPI000D6876A4|nr:ATP-binding protein [Occallatibacter savannae]